MAWHLRIVNDRGLRFPYPCMLWIHSHLTFKDLLYHMKCDGVYEAAYMLSVYFSELLPLHVLIGCIICKCTDHGNHSFKGHALLIHHVHHRTCIIALNFL